MNAVAARLHEPRPWWRAALWLAGLGPFFFASYGTANWLASRRGAVGSLYFGWEHGVPFLPWTIVPYWSIDLFYAASLFLCADRRELDAHARRLLTAQVVAVAGFLLLPLRFAFERPPVDGLPGALFTALAGFDLPYNQAPSLHIALLVILWARYRAHTPRRWRWLLHGWSALIAVSVLTTWQHHFIDVPTGLWVGLLAIALFPSDGTRPAPTRPDAPRLRLAGRYALGAAACTVLAAALGGPGWWLLWPAGALAAVAGIYLAGDPRLFRKRADGRLHPAALWLLAPYVAGAWLNARLWTRGDRAAGEVAPGVWLGCAPRRREREAAGFDALLDLAAELPVDRRGVSSRAVPLLDLLVPTPAQLDAAVAALERLRGERHTTLVFCALGYSRSAVVTAAWLLASGRAADVEAAIAAVRQARPRVVLGPALRAALTDWARTRGLQP
ncbi:dual specificity protein phosphatase-like protein [Plasticicumulans lactativorans]|uniref:Dual specificity protein phosphatase-like protein n=1 Tax=Plasticicumulans lactativorans TaxID=1133106 RepID=A0A4R2LQ72_9GAMM|nr:phosphatase PAP2/dual specificity phosphatase family protein [Plasticicumulans lactativorans]TCO81704.1 dual specificity protein phosphatase-like protein [Plasticicumulans lactativorans]